MNAHFTRLAARLPFCLYVCAVALLLSAPAAAADSRASTVPASATAGFDVPGYIAELDRWSAELARPGGQPPAGWQAMRQSLPAAWTVDAGGQRFNISTAWLAQGLEKLSRESPESDAVRRGLQARVAAMREQASAFGATAGFEAAGASGARAKLDRIMNRREFRNVRRPAGPNWLQRLRERLATVLAELLYVTFGRIGTSPRAGRVIVWSIIALAFAAMAIWLKRMIARSSPEPLLRLEAPLFRSRDWRQWAAEAAATANTGDYREAIRCAYWSAVLRLEEAGTWRPDRARTPREYLRLLPSASAHRPPLADLTRRFELSWYGNRPTGTGDFQLALQQLERIGCALSSSPATARS